jgi:hypothetical protein
MAVTWSESPQRGTWAAELNGTVPVTLLGLDRWQPAAGDARGPVQKTRLEARREAEKLALDQRKRASNSPARVLTTGAGQQPPEGS